jgi:hypothetical protein
MNVLAWREDNGPLIENASVKRPIWEPGVLGRRPSVSGYLSIHEPEVRLRLKSSLAPCEVFLMAGDGFRYAI